MLLSVWYTHSVLKMSAKGGKGGKVISLSRKGGSGRRPPPAATTGVKRERAGNAKAKPASAAAPPAPPTVRRPFFLPALSALGEAEDPPEGRRVAGAGGDDGEGLPPLAAASARVASICEAAACELEACYGHAIGM